MTCCLTQQQLQQQTRQQAAASRRQPPRQQSHQQPQQPQQWLMLRNPLYDPSSATYARSTLRPRLALAMSLVHPLVPGLSMNPYVLEGGAAGAARRNHQPHHWAR